MFLIDCSLGSLADFVMKCSLADFKEIFHDLINTDVTVSLILHLNDDCDAKRDASKNATQKVLLTFEDQHLTGLADLLNARTFDYVEFLRDFSKTENPKLRDFFPNHVTRYSFYLSHF